MKVKAKILDERDDKNSKCFLSRMSLESYVNALPSSYQDYDVQREIVSNVYLDHLVDTVLNRCHIPPIVLVIDGAKYNIKDGFLEIDAFKILDGLQRTFRLQAIRKTIEFCCEQLDPDEDYLSWSKFKFSRTYSSQLHEFNSNTDVLRAVVEMFKRDGKESLLKTFTDNSQWFEIWTELTPQEEVRKMLMLNAGHKPVTTRHQLELLFLNLLPILRDGEGQDFKLVREKEINATQFSKGREIGTFHFAHVVTALLSFYTGKPVSPSANLIQSLQSADSDLGSYLELADPEVLKAVVLFLVRLDRILASQYEDHGCLWMGREVSLAGLFGALGAFAVETGRERVEVMNSFYNICLQFPKILNLQQFEEVRNNLDLSKINIGNVNRSAVFSAIKDILGNNPPSISNWKIHFKVEEK
ncbi:TPA: hypothetical protein SBJ50_004334 [Yersinia enterocolitica]|nr:hypothetical protein [Yersinia enterocolitica]ELI7979513.1 hypothetical protein [Yersinia enterocolitica]ELI9226504.1 hypothetical protein [Yersinia enterocolitica]ELW7370102.1 hypothetical protein [Yersinia enterocolitica]ELY5234548.1 hypothetical protein [Yersinia enterocolitica]